MAKKPAKRAIPPGLAHFGVLIPDSLAAEIRGAKVATGISIARIVEQGIRLRLAEIRAGRLMSGEQASA